MSSRIAVILYLLCAVTAHAADITFVSPQVGSQAVGVQPIEVTTSAKSVDRVEFYVDHNLAGAARKPPYRIMHDFGTALGGHTVVAKVYSNGYRSEVTAEIVTSSLSTAGELLNVDFVEVPLRVRASRTLHAADFRVRENGVEQTIREARSDRGPAHFFFVIDRSLSMGDGKLTAALGAIDRELNQLRPGDRVDVIAFNHIVSRPRTLRTGDLVSKLASDVTPSGGTSLRDAVSSIATESQAYVIVITDGGDRNSETSEEQALRKISRTKTVVDAIILGDNSSFLERAASNTGGTVARATPSTIQRELHKIFLDINSRYTLAYQSQVHTPGWRAIEIQPRRRDVAILKARRGYFAE